MTKEIVLKNLRTLIGRKFDQNEVICAFEDFEEDGETNIVVSDSDNTGYDKIAYINRVGATGFYFDLNKERIVDVWMK
ncbi:hypothetical protein HMPREF1215_00714 [Coprococcus sp. HPP0074]|nr:hypothetical protein HMPREF1215_00714 [Coprococcus sp. HPP0074]